MKLPPKDSAELSSLLRLLIGKIHTLSAREARSVMDIDDRVRRGAATLDDLMGLRVIANQK